ncbi:MAG: hypothetical protein LBQ27_02125 [Clostridiales bacterium]|jgi:hypothetical protein|nr:hypothetical protein [Clostridiales bacterium]
MIKNNNASGFLTGERNVLVDNVKGLIILLFAVTNIYFNATLSFDMPEWAIHTGDIENIPFWSYLNFSLMDFGPAVFFFLIGLTVFPAFSKRVARDGSRAAFKHFFYRNAAIFGIFMAITFLQNKITDGTRDWDTIQSVGFTGLLLIPFMSTYMRKHTWTRAVAAAVVLLLFQFFHAQIYMFHGWQGGAAACVGYLGIVLVSSVLADAAKKGVTAYAAASVLVVIAAVLSDKYFGKSQFFTDYNTTYMLMSTAVLNTAYFVFYILDKIVIKNRPVPVLATMGRNLMLYLFLSLAILAVLELFLKDYPLNPTQLIIFETTTVCAYVLLSVLLKKKNITFKL